MKDTFSVRIMSPVAMVWQAEATSLTAENSEGLFDILPDHARFMSLLSDTPVTVELADGLSKEFTFTNSLLFFDDNQAVIYIQESLKNI